MMTRREAQQRAAVYGKYIASRRHPTKDQLMFAAAKHDWTYAELQVARWREDIEDAVLDCGRG